MHKKVVREHGTGKMDELLRRTRLQRDGTIAGEWMIGLPVRSACITPTDEAMESAWFIVLVRWWFSRLADGARGRKIGRQIGDDEFASTPTDTARATSESSLAW